MFVKICANTNLQDAQLAAELGADAVGFVFAPSSRQVTVSQVAAMTKKLPDSVMKVGVFNSQDVGMVVGAIRAAGITCAQLHTVPNAALIQTIANSFEGRVKVIQVVPRDMAPVNQADSDDRFKKRLDFVLGTAGVWGVLIDAAKGAKSGGLGATFDWDKAKPIVDEAYANRKKAFEAPKLIIAGGLSAENVGKMISVMKPDGVDLASGVESEPGKKDPAKMREFFEAVRKASA